MRVNGHRASNAVNGAASHELPIERLVAEEAPRLYRVLMFLLRDEKRAVSILGESFLDALRADRPHADAAFPHRLYAAAVSRARAVVRGAHRPDPGRSPSTVEAALAELNMDQRVCLALCDVAGMTTRDAATVLNVHRRTCCRRLHDARTTLCKKLHPNASMPS